MPWIRNVALRTMAFQLRKLRLISTKAPKAEVEFSAGLNVVSGSSNTGKSFLVEMIRFALGRQELRRTIPQAALYDRVFLTIETDGGQTHTIVRAIAGGDAYVFQGNGDSVPAEAKAFATRGGGSDEESFAPFLVGLAGLGGKLIRQKQFSTRSIAFRDIRDVVIVDEEAIITSDSPIHSNEQRTDATSQSSVFSLLLTGVDDAALVEAEINKEKRED